MDDRLNPMRPELGTLVGIKNTAKDIKLLQIRLQDGAAFDHRPGQFAFVSAFGVGEVPFGLASTAQRTDLLEFAVNRVGTVTNALHDMEPGATVGVRGPMGNSFPLEQIKGKDVVVLGGGIGGAPLRPVIHSILDNRQDYGKLTIVWAARSPDLLVFTDEYEDWANAPNTDLHITVDAGTESWTGNVGLITQLLEKVGPSHDNAVAIICGPPIMIKFTILTLQKLKFDPQQMLMTLEAKMKCGIGKCGRCNMGDKFVCIHGPVFWYTEVADFLESFD
jgi:sulfhydrogenase subunit gamma (sulfur reductase)